MTEEGRAADSGMVGRTLCDIAQVLESAQGAGGRMRRVLELLGELVPYQQCALLDAEAGFDPRLLAFPALAPDEKDVLAHALIRLFGKMLEERALAPGPSAVPWHAHLAVPLIGLDEVIGVLFVRRDEGTYEKEDLRLLSLVGAQLAAYLTMLRARAEVAGRAWELENAQQAASSAPRTKDELVNLVAHELRAPLATAMAWVRVLGSREMAPDERARAVEAIERSVRAQTKLVDHLVDLAFIATGSLVRRDPRPVQPARSIEAAIDSLRPLAKQRSIRLEATLDPSAQPLVGDRERLDEVLTILLATAIRFTPDGGRVEVRLETTGAGSRLQVSDSGKGIDPDSLSHVFDRSTGVEGSPATLSRGGLGLAIVKQLVELQGGSIRAESGGEDKGTTLIVELPHLRHELLPQV